ncbi:helix-turn-helix domain-containing protein [Nocardia sp. NBC_01329]|uniref:helix-turn-helix domain-containing protein n=1 Tax=Nocardia sp. NBC_01329 TaxID=2903594 RepID=UPI002E0D7096|nr:helix-turn-helix domain-containing protein [Nocardia sp. NBC_01329]
MSNRRDRLRELLDAVLDEDNSTLGEMAAGAYASPFHFSRQFSRATGESPVGLRRRILLERACWQLGKGASVTEVAFAAGYDSVEGFSRAFARAFGHPPSATPPPTGRAARWLPSVNGIHFHPPMSLWVEGEPKGRSDMDPTALLLHHDLEDTRLLLEAASGLSDEQYRRIRSAGAVVLPWDGPEESIAAMLHHLIQSKEVWLASIDGADTPAPAGDDPAALTARLDKVGPRWLETVREIDRRGGWGDTLIDALCDPPESFVLGSVIAHVLSYAAYRRQQIRYWLHSESSEEKVGWGDPIDWLRKRSST